MSESTKKINDLLPLSPDHNAERLGDYLKHQSQIQSDVIAEVPLLRASTSWARSICR